MERALAQLEFRAEPADGPAGRLLIAAFHEEIAGIYPFWTPSIGPSADPEDFELYISAGYGEVPDCNGNPAASYWFEKALV